VTVAHAYDATGAAWQQGPERVYQRLADVLVAASPVGLAGRVVADVGAGTGVAGRSIARAGGHPIALDLAEGMLRVEQSARPAAVVADARRLPLASGSCGGVVAAFTYNHVPDPELALADAARVVAPGGVVLASAYAADDTHPVKAAVEEAVAEVGWVAPAWHGDLKAHSIPVLASIEGARRASEAAGLDADVQRVEVAFPELGPRELVAWRMGMAQVAPFVAGLSEVARASLERRALELLGPDPEPLIRRVILIIARI
jgi:ubiquinone/menaquinone biosynthesis C-methylase UbiE